MKKILLVTCLVVVFVVGVFMFAACSNDSFNKNTDLKELYQSFVDADSITLERAYDEEILLTFYLTKDAYVYKNNNNESLFVKDGEEYYSFMRNVGETDWGAKIPADTSNLPDSFVKMFTENEEFKAFFDNELYDFKDGKFISKDDVNWGEKLDLDTNGHENIIVTIEKNGDNGYLLKLTSTKDEKTETVCYYFKNINNTTIDIPELD